MVALLLRTASGTLNRVNTRLFDSSTFVTGRREEENTDRADVFTLAIANPFFVPLVTLCRVGVFGLLCLTGFASSDRRRSVLADLCSGESGSASGVRKASF